MLRNIPESSHSDELELAIWFHDAVYDVRACDNEDESAKFFAKMFEGFISKDMIEDVMNLIMVAAHGQIVAVTPEEKLLVDLDLLILSADKNRYDRYAKEIRQEYQDVSSDEYREGRQRFLEQFLQKTIYRTDFFKEFNSFAIANLQREIRGLNTVV